jgi:LysM repeat protein
MLSAPTTLRAKKMGYPMLADLQMLGLEYQHTGIATTKSLIKSKPELVRDFMRAYVEGIHYAKTHRGETLEILAKYLRTDDKEILDDTYDSIAVNLVPEKPYPTLKGIQIILRELGIKDPNARSAKPEQFVDLTFIKELDSSGFIDRLYKSTAVAKAAPPRPEPLPALEVTKEKSAPSEAKAKTPTAEEKAKPVAKQMLPSTEKPAAPVIAKASAPAPQEYTVKAGDTLSKLSERFYNSPYKWEMIYEANRDTVKNPHYIYIGQKLMIPSDGRAG